MRTPGTAFEPVWGEHEPVQSTDGSTLAVTVPGLSTVVLRAAEPVPTADRPPQATFTLWGTAPAVPGTDRRAVSVQVEGSAPVDVTFERRVGAGEWEVLGTDDSSPYGVLVTVPRETVTYRALVRDLAGRTTVVESPEAR